MRFCCLSMSRSWIPKNVEIASTPPVWSPGKFVGGPTSAVATVKVPPRPTSLITSFSMTLSAPSTLTSLITSTSLITCTSTGTSFSTTTSLMVSTCTGTSLTTSTTSVEPQPKRNTALRVVKRAATGNFLENLISVISSLMNILTTC